MKRMLLAAAALSAAGCLPLQEKDAIVVNGEGVVMATPEIFTVSAMIYSQEETQAEALAKVSAMLNRILEDLPRLEGLEKIEIKPSTAEIRPVYNLDCLSRASYEQDAACAVEGYFAKVSLTARGAPANFAGNALSLLSEFGAQETELNGYSVADYDAVMAEAAGAAMKNARQKADRLASAAGATLGGPTRIQYGEGFDDGDGRRYVTAFSPPPQIVVTGSRIEAATNLNLTPQPFEVRETVKAAFAIE